MAEVSWSYGQQGMMMGPLLTDVKRCPHCSIAAPRLSRVWASDGPTPRTDGYDGTCWGAYACSVCGGVVLARGDLMRGTQIVGEIFPDQKLAHEDIPEAARRYLQQAYETLHAPDASTVMAGSAVDAMLKAKSYVSGSLYSRIDAALADNVLTQGMATWAHSVRLEANSVRHADAGKPHATLEDAKQSVEFAEALGNFLFVLTAKIDRGIEAAKIAVS